MKQVISVFLAVMLFAALAIVPGFADSLSVEVSTAEAAPGETVTLDFTLSGNPGIAAYSADLIFSQSSLELVSLASGREIRGLTVMSYVPTKRVAAFSTSNTAGDGVLFRATFRVLSDAEEGFAPVTLNITQMADVSYTDYDPEIISGGITVTAAAAGSDDGGEEPAGDTEVEINNSVVIEPDESMDAGELTGEGLIGDTGEGEVPVVVITPDPAAASSRNDGAATAAAAAEEPTSDGEDSEPGAEADDETNTPAANNSTAADDEPSGSDQKTENDGESPQTTPDPGGTDDESSPVIWIVGAVLAVCVVAVVVYILLNRKKKTGAEKETEKISAD